MRLRILYAGLIGRNADDSIRSVAMRALEVHVYRLLVELSHWLFLALLCIGLPVMLLIAVRLPRAWILAGATLCGTRAAASCAIAEHATPAFQSRQFKAAARCQRIDRERCRNFTQRRDASLSRLAKPIVLLLTSAIMRDGRTLLLEWSDT
jgi:hypothetical protein